MSDDVAFLDTNVLIYAYSEDDLRKQNIAVNAIDTHKCIVSTHILNEFCNVCIKKLHYPIDQILESINEILHACALFMVNENTIKEALVIQDRYKYSYYDSLVIASALKCECTLLLSEDLQDSQKINNTTIKNIFI
ncbi:PIN domain-containing protein [Treponema primitia]|nr:PIN domain-containing protein [Treponema primitia]